MTLNSYSPTSAMKFYLDQVGIGFKVSEHFLLGEFASKCGSNQILLHHALITGVQAIRTATGGALRINSGYRSPSHNASVGGSAKSLHMIGLAADISSDTHSPEQLAHIASKLGMVARPYRTFCHVDVGQPRTW